MLALYHAATVSDVDVSAFVGKIFADIKLKSDEIRFILPDGTYYRMHHKQDCCESVVIEDVCGNFDDLIGTEILSAEESTSAESDGKEHDDSFLFTFYNIRSVKGTVTIRWLGESNGCYSEEVDIEHVTDTGLDNHGEVSDQIKLFGGDKI